MQDANDGTTTDDGDRDGPTRSATDRRTDGPDRAATIRRGIRGPNGPVDGRRATAYRVR